MARVDRRWFPSEKPSARWRALARVDPFCYWDCYRGGRLMAPTSLFRWNARSGRYVDARTGRFVSQTTVRAELDHALVQASRETRALAERLRSRTISLRRWELEMRRQVRRAQLYSAAAAKGGWAQMDPADFGRAGREIRDQYAYLKRFARQIRSGQQPLDGRFLQRTELYVEAGRTTYHATELADARRRGRTETRNVLHPADHCEGAGSCVEQSGRGWVPIGSLLPIGRRLCLARCKCTVEYR